MLEFKGGVSLPQILVSINCQTNGSALKEWKKSKHVKDSSIPIPQQWCSQIMGPAVMSNGITSCSAVCYIELHCIAIPFLALLFVVVQVIIMSFIVMICFAMNCVVLYSNVLCCI